MRKEEKEKSEIISRQWMTFEEVDLCQDKMNSLSKEAWEKFKAKIEEKRLKK